MLGANQWNKLFASRLLSAWPEMNKELSKSEVEFESDGVILRGWIARPNEEQHLPLIVLIHGLSGIAALDLADYAEQFVAAGFACFAYDHRNWGESDGTPRSESDPWRQVADLRNAISFARSQDWVDSERIGIWGTSYGGGHVLTVAALDKRVKCAVAQVPLISGSRTFDTWVPNASRAEFLQKLAADRDARFRGESPKTVPAAIKGGETAEWIETKDVSNAYVNELTVRSFELLRTYEPVSFVEAISPTPLLMIIASQDTTTPTDWQRDAYGLIGEPKKLVEIDGRHYDVYMDGLDEAANAACQWYGEFL